MFSIKPILRVILILATVTTAAAVAAKECPAVDIDETVSIAATATREEDIDLTSPVLDDFNDCGLQNHWGGQTGGFNSLIGGECTPTNYNENPSNVRGKTGCSLKLEYNVGALNSFAGYYSKIVQGATPYRDLSGYKYLTFWVKGSAGGDFFKVELKNNSSNPARDHAAVYITDYLDGGVITTSWRKVTIPLDSFVNLDSFSNINEFVIVFENYQCGLNGSPTSGTIFIDDISFGNYFLGYCRVDHFGDNLGTIALGGNMGDMQPNDPPPEDYSHQFSASPGEYWSHPRGLESTYNTGGGNPWGGQFMIFGGGPDGWTSIPHNFSAYAWLTFRVKAKSATENPEGIKIELVTTDPWGGYFWVIPGTITTDWKYYAFILSDLSLTTVKQMNLVYEKWRIDEWGGDRVGALYFDNIEFQSLSHYENGPDVSPPSAPTNLQDDGVPVTTGYHFGNVNVLTVACDPYSDDPINNIENVRFEYSRDGVNWFTIGTDYNTGDSIYSTIWNTEGLTPASDYQIRCVSQDGAGNEGVMAAITGCIVD